jgi:PAS domain S-box-containing protein
MDKRKNDRVTRVPERVVLSISIIVVSAIGGLSYINARSADRASAALTTARSVVKLDNELLSAIKDAETGQRGFLLSGQEQYLDPYNRALSAVPGLLSQLESATRSTPDQNQQVKRIEPLVAVKFAELKQTIDLRRSNNTAQALAIVNAGTGKAAMDEIRVRCQTLYQLADQRLLRFDAIASLNTSRLRIVATVGSGLLLAFLLITIATVFRGLDRRDELFAQAFANEKRLAVTLASIGDAVIATDASAKITILNPVASQLTGWREEDARGRHISEVLRMVNETTRDAVENPLLRALAEGKAVGLANHTKLIARDGGEVFIDDSAAPIRNEGGVIIGGVLIFRDISEQRQSEYEITQSRIALQRSNEELQQFAFVASHDLKSPLRLVNTMAQLLEKRFGDKLGPDGSAMVSHITEATDRMTRLIEDLLSLATETALPAQTLQATPMQDVFNMVCAGLREEIEVAGATITAGPLPLVAARDTHVLLVLQNVLSNAVKYRDTVPPDIEVSAVRENSEWIISVKDNGIGIDPRYFEQIFEPFKRLHGREYEGTGIGLWSCKKIVSGYSGRIWVESPAGKGSTFFFSLPAVSESQVSNLTT